MRATKLIFNAPMLLSVMVCLLMSIFIVSFATPVAHAAQSIPYKINFQGRLTDATGNIKPDGAYNMRIRIYDSLSNGNLLWTADRSYTGSGSADHRVTVTNGLFSVQLGDTATGVGDPALPPSLFNTQTYGGLYIEVELASTATATGTSPAWTEGAMTPRSQLGAAPYAYNADTLDGVDGSSYVRNDTTNTLYATNTIQSADLNFMGSSYINFNQYYNSSSSTAYSIQNAGNSAQILNTPDLGLALLVSAPKSAGAEAANKGGMIIQAVNDNLRATVDNGVTYGANLAANPGFEFGGCAGWETSGTGSSSCQADTGNAKTGLKAGKFTVPGSTATTASNRMVAVTQGDVLYAQGFAKSSATNTGTGGVAINFFNGSGGYAGTAGTSDLTNPGTSYVGKATGLVTVPAGVSFAAVAITAGAGGSPGSWYFDDLGLYVASSFVPMTYKNGANSTAAFQIQDAGGTPLFMADTLNNALLIGGGDVTPAANITLLILDSKNTTGDPTGRAGAMYYNSSSGKFRCYEVSTWRNCADGLAYSNTTVPAGNTVSNSTNETSFASAYTIPANDCQPGRTYSVKARGVYGTTTGPPNLTMRVKIGTTIVGVPTVVSTTASMTNRQWTLDFTIVCDTAGSSGTVEGQGELKRYTSGSAATLYEMVNTGTATVNTTTAQTLQISAQWGTANTLNTVTLRQLTIEAMGPS